MNSDIFGNLLAGLGLFFIGVKFIGDHMKQMAGRRFRQLVTKFTEHPVLAGVWGMISGALMQSTSAVTFIMISLISAGLITVRRAMPIITWSNVGTSVLVFLAVLDIHLVVLYLLAATGFCYYLNLDRSTRYRHLVGATLGIGLLFMGLQLMKAGAYPLKEVEWFARLLDFTRNSFLLAFFIGALLTFIAQSSSTVTVVAIALAKAGLLGFDQALMIVYGTNFGSSLSVWFMAGNLRGVPKQLALFQVGVKWIGVAVTVPLFYVERFTDIPLLKALITSMGGDVSHQMAMAYLIFQVLSVLLVMCFTTPIYRLLERLSPPTREEELSKPHYLYEQALEEPETALTLVDKEQVRLAQYLPQYLDAVREETREQAGTHWVTLHKASTTVLKQVDAFTTDLMDQSHSRSTLEQVIRLQNRNGLLLSLSESVHDLTKTIDQSSHSEALNALTDRMAEALHAVLLTAVDALETPDADNRELLLKLTADRGELMERIRRTVIRSEQSLTSEDQQTLFAVTTLFERTIWLLRRLGTVLGDDESGE